MPAESFKRHVASDGTLLGNAGKWGACGWAVVQLDYDEEMGPLHGMYGSMMEAEFEVHHTIKRAGLTAFLCLLKKVCGPIKVHVENKGIIDGLRKGEKECRLVDKHFGKNYMNWCKEASWWKWHVRRHTARRKKKKR